MTIGANSPTMYIGDHIALSTGLSIALSRRLRLAFVPLATGLILLNLIDLDHLVFYRLDDGTANSLTLHPLHIYGGVIIFVLSLAPLFSRLRIEVAYALISGLSLHLAADALAYALEYSVPVLGGLGLLIVAGLALLVRARLRPRYAGAVIAFGVLAWLLPNGSQAFMHFGLELDPQRSLAPWIVPQLWTLTLGLAFWLAFSRWEPPILEAGDGAAPRA